MLTYSLGLMTLLHLSADVYGKVHRGLRWNEVVDSRWDTPIGRTYPVSTTDEIANLQNDLVAGDVMVMKAGEWNNPRFTLTASGASGTGKKVYLMPEVLGDVRLTGDVRFIIQGDYVEVRGMWLDGMSDSKITPVTFDKGSSHGRFTNCAITNFNPTVHDKKYHWIEIWGSEHTVDYCALEGKQGIGQLIRVKTDNDDHLPPGTQPHSWGHLIARNYFGPREDTGLDDGEGIQIGLKESEWVETKTIMEYNYFYQYDAEIECISVKASNNTVRWNTFRDSACLVTLRHSDNTRVQENYFYCGGKSNCGGIRVYGEDHVVINNYVEEAYAGPGGSRAGIVLYTGDKDDAYKRSASNNEFVRNLCYKCAYGFFIGTKPSTSADVYPSNNYFFKNLLTGSSSTDYCVREVVDNVNPTWDINNVWECQVDNIEGSDGGIRVRDPVFVYDSEFKIYSPTDADFEFKMKYPPVEESDVGPTWR